MLPIRLLILLALLATPIQGIWFITVLGIGVVAIASPFILAGVAYVVFGAVLAAKDMEVTRRVTVNGHMYCIDNNGTLQPLKAHVYIYERDWGNALDPHDYQKSALTNEEGHFELKGEEMERTSMPEFALEVDILCKNPREKKGPMVDICQDTTFKKK
ncbi:hypothetical protein PMAYCL1PPCAC_00970, partial [Pristionchus mayeri]